MTHSKDPGKDKARLYRVHNPRTLVHECTLSTADEGIPDERNVSTFKENLSVPFGHENKPKTVKEKMGSDEVAAIGVVPTNKYKAVPRATDLNPTTVSTGKAAGEKPICVPECVMAEKSLTTAPMVLGGVRT